MEIKVTAKEIESMEKGYLPVVDAVCIAMGLEKPERRGEWEDVVAVGSSIIKDDNGNITISIKEDCVCEFTDKASGFLMKFAAKLSSLLIFCKGLFSELVEEFNDFERRWGVNETLLTEEQKKLLDEEMEKWWNNELKFRRDTHFPISGIEAAAEREREYLLHVMLGRVRDSEGNIVKFEPKESEFCHSRIH